jgi:DNA polymerase-3 subunit epsilon
MVIVRPIDHTGIDLTGWLTPASSTGVVTPKPAALGPFKSQRMAIMGASRHGPLAQWPAQLGGRILASVGLTTSSLVVSRDHSFGKSSLSGLADSGAVGQVTAADGPSASALTSASSRSRK